MGAGDIEGVASEPALHLQYLGHNGPIEGPSSFVTGGVKHHASSERLWGGDGILKTVRLDRVEVSVQEPETSLPKPQSAMLSPKEFRKGVGS